MIVRWILQAIAFALVAAACAGPSTVATPGPASPSPTEIATTIPETPPPQLSTAEPSPTGASTAPATELPGPTPTADLTPAQTPATEPFVLTSPAFADGQPIPTRYTCDGADDQLPVEWSGVPEGTIELALIQHDPDAGGFIHWIVLGIPADATGLIGSLPEGARHGLNDFNRVNYMGPCPPRGNHTYVMTLFALAQPLSLVDTPTARQLRNAAAELTIAQAQLRGTYRRT